MRNCLALEIEESGSKFDVGDILIIMQMGINEPEIIEHQGDFYLIHEGGLPEHLIGDYEAEGKVLMIIKDGHIAEIQYPKTPRTKSNE